MGGLRVAVVVKCDKAGTASQNHCKIVATNGSANVFISKELKK